MAETSPSTWTYVKDQWENGNNELVNVSAAEFYPDWCVCGQCIEMPEARLRVCCQNKNKNHEHPEFLHLILDDKILDLAMRNNASYLHYPFNPEDNACWRYTAYRQYILWYWSFRERK